MEDNRTGLQKLIDASTWDLGLPKIIGKQEDWAYCVYAWYSDGRKVLLSYRKKDISYTIKHEDFNKELETPLQGYFIDAWSENCIVGGDTEEEIEKILRANKEHFFRIHQEYLDNEDPNDFID